MLNNIKLLLGLSGTTKDSLLNLLISHATEEAIEYTHNSDVAELESVIEKMVVYNYNRIGTEGVDSEGYSGVSFNYSTDYPDNIMRALKANRKIRTI